jgi:hypothetical protein
MKGKGFKVVPVLALLTTLLVVGLVAGCNGDDDPWKPPTDQSINSPVGIRDTIPDGMAAGVRDPGGNVGNDLDGVRDPGGNRDPWRDTTAVRLGSISDGLRDTTAH